MKKSERRLGIRLFLAVIYLMIITILFICGYKIYKDTNEVKPFQDVTTTDEYSYINVSKMSDKFAYSEKDNIGIHFVIEREDTGLWHTYIIAIKEDEISKYEDLIKYGKGELDRIPKPIKVYGYPVNITNEVKEMAIKNINSFLPSTNEVKITNDNYEEYLTNSYLDTTKKQEEKLPPELMLISTLFVIVTFLLLLIIIDKNILVDRLDKNLKKLTRKK